MTVDVPGRISGGMYLDALAAVVLTLSQGWDSEARHAEDILVEYREGLAWVWGVISSGLLTTLILPSILSLTKSSCQDQKNQTFQ